MKKLWALVTWQKPKNFPLQCTCYCAKFGNLIATSPQLNQAIRKYRPSSGGVFSSSQSRGGTKVDPFQQGCTASCHMESS